MRYRRYSSKSLNEKFGNLVLMPIKIMLVALILVIFVILVPILYVPGVLYFFYNYEDMKLISRIKTSLMWPLEIFMNALALNEILGLGGYDNSKISRVNQWLVKKTRK